MASIVSSLYRTYNVYSDDKTPHRVKKIIADLEALVPKVSGRERVELIQKIERIKEKARSGNVDQSLNALLLDVYEYAAGFVGGPLGNSFAVYTVHDLKRRYLENEKIQILKAEKIAGKRVIRKCKEKKSTKKTSALGQAVLVGVVGLAVGLTGIQAIACGAAYYAYDSLTNSLNG